MFDVTFLILAVVTIVGVAQWFKTLVKKLTGWEVPGKVLVLAIPVVTVVVAALRVYALDPTANLWGLLANVALLTLVLTALNELFYGVIFQAAQRLFTGGQAVDLQAVTLSEAVAAPAGSPVTAPNASNPPAAGSAS